MLRSATEDGPWRVAVGAIAKRNQSRKVGAARRAVRGDLGAEDRSPRRGDSTVRQRAEPSARAPMETREGAYAPRNDDSGLWIFNPCRNSSAGRGSAALPSQGKRVSGRYGMISR